MVGSEEGFQVGRYVVGVYVGFADGLAVQGYKDPYEAVCAVERQEA